MTSKSLEAIRLELAKLDRYASGRYGETFAKQWFTTNKWAFEEIDQSLNTKPAKLKTLGGKRPDFIVDSGDPSIITTVDAKFATTNEGKVFCMPEWEIEQYRKFKIFSNE